MRLPVNMLMRVCTRGARARCRRRRRARRRVQMQAQMRKIGRLPCLCQRLFDALLLLARHLQVTFHLQTQAARVDVEHGRRARQERLDGVCRSAAATAAVERQVTRRRRVGKRLPVGTAPSNFRLVRRRSAIGPQAEELAPERTADARNVQHAPGRLAQTGRLRGRRRWRLMRIDVVIDVIGLEQRRTAGSSIVPRIGVILSAQSILVLVGDVRRRHGRFDGGCVDGERGRRSVATVAAAAFCQRRRRVTAGHHGTRVALGAAMRHQTVAVMDVDLFDVDARQPNVAVAHERVPFVAAAAAAAAEALAHPRHIVDTVVLLVRIRRRSCIAHYGIFLAYALISHYRRYRRCRRRPASNKRRPHEHYRHFFLVAVC